MRTNRRKHRLPHPETRAPLRCFASLTQGERHTIKLIIITTQRRRATTNNPEWTKHRNFATRASLFIRLRGIAGKPFHLKTRSTLLEQRRGHLWVAPGDSPARYFGGNNVLVFSRIGCSVFSHQLQNSVPDFAVLFHSPGTDIFPSRMEGRHDRR